ncbi:hypothetical protein FA95DRAFT_373156 [Auriscalpium vulgare]|uniref:Uncharacterized protein n=1 Tax=Auriscalpium vulgare TaxID=40419 RepID=A0ACB8RIY8_9AGAM|nr:hypothetical protein FA95DRAFT_373156 [Auriscalpium vulgare]
MSQIRNNLDALQRRAATHASTSGATASITTATPVQKVNKFKPAKTTTPSIAPARKTPPLKGLPSFSTPGFGKMKPAAPAVSRVRATGSHETIDISSSDSSPPSPASIPAKRASSDTEASLGVPTSPKRHKVAAVANKENLSYVTPSSWKGKGKETYVDELASNSTLEVAEPFVASGSLSNISVANRSLPSITPVPSVGTEHTDLQSVRSNIIYASPATF